MLRLGIARHVALGATLVGTGCASGPAPTEEATVELRSSEARSSSRGAGASSTPTDGPVRFVRVPITTGEQCNDELEERSEVVAAGDRRVLEPWMFGWHARSEVLDAKDGRPTRARVAFEKFEHARFGAPLVGAAGPRIGVTYIFASAPGGVDVDDETGRLLTVEEQDFLIPWWSDRRPERTEEALDGQLVSPGQRVDQLAALHEEVYPGRNMSPRVYTFEGRDRRGARFAFRIDVTNENTDLRSQVIGKVWVGVPRGTLIREEHQTTMTDREGILRKSTLRIERSCQPSPLR